MADETFRYALLAGLAIALVVAAGTDLASRRIANSLNAAVALGAPLFWWASGLSLWPDVALQLGFAIACLAILAALFAMRAMGGGDVKLLSALALWIPPALFFKLVVLMALLGGVLTVVIAARHLLRKRAGPVMVPYGVAIAVAGLWVIATDFVVLPGGAQLLG